MRRPNYNSFYGQNYSNICQLASANRIYLVDTSIAISVEKTLLKGYYGCLLPNYLLIVVIYFSISQNSYHLTSLYHVTMCHMIPAVKYAKTEL